MASADLPLIERRLRRKYEWARARRAFWGFTPSLLIVAAATLFAKHPTSALTFGAGMFVFGVAALWYGRNVRKAVLPGVALGLIPLTLALCANHLGHTCMGGACMSVCMPACTAGGLVAGVGMAIVGHRQRQGLGYWLAASAIAVLTGAMGCSCVGYAGVVGLMLGFSVGLVPALARRFFGRAI
jgi:hypothetical protein